MKILMLGWEYPPKISGGLGVASQGLAEALAADHQVHFLLPKKSKKQVSRSVKLINAAAIKPNERLWKKTKKYIQILEEIELGQLLIPYLPPKIFQKVKKTQKVITELESTTEWELFDQIKLTGTYSDSLEAEATKYAMLALQKARQLKVDVVHAHDWVTFRAGMMIQKKLGIPFVAHVHSTEHDRNGIHANAEIEKIEREGLQEAMHIICVSRQQQSIIAAKYQIDIQKISIVPNASDVKPPAQKRINKVPQIAFIGRFTHQKNPGVLVSLATDLSSKGYNFTYSYFGDGYLDEQLRQQVAGANLSDQFTFHGFQDHTKILQALNQIDLVIMPSVAEPFGLVALEAVLKKVPVIATEGVGVSEFIPSMNLVAPWDQYGLSKLAEQLLTDDAFRKSSVNACLKEAQKLTWSHSANLTSKVYGKVKEGML